MGIVCDFVDMYKQDGLEYFRLRNVEGTLGLFTETYLLKNIKNNNLLVSNLKIAKGRIVQKTEKDISIEKYIKTFEKYKNFNNAISKLYYYEHEVMFEKKIYFLQIKKDTLLVYIPDNITNDVVWGESCTELFDDRLFDDVQDNDIEGVISSCIFLTNVKKLKVIGGRHLTDCSEMFLSCKLDVLDLKDFDTSNVNDMAYMFKHAKIDKIEFGDFDTSEVISMTEMFSYFKGFDLDLSCFNTSNVSFMEEMFCSCSINRKLNISSFDTSNVVNMIGMLEDCFVFCDLELNNFNTSNVSSMQRMFSGAKIRVLDLSSFDTSKVIDMRRMFSGCEAVRINVTSFDVSNTKYLYGMFMNCNLSVLDVDNFDFSNTSELHSMFMGVYIRTLRIKGKGIDNTENVLTDIFRDSMIETLFTESDKLKTIFVSVS